jgi:hypothetical protein
MKILLPTEGGLTEISFSDLADMAFPKRFKKITFILSDKWKYGLVSDLKLEMAKTRDIGVLMKTLIPKYKEHAKQVASLILMYCKNPSRLPSYVLSQEEERAVLEEFIKNEALKW